MNECLFGLAGVAAGVFLVVDAAGTGELTAKGCVAVFITGEACPVGCLVSVFMGGVGSITGLWRVACLTGVGSRTICLTGVGSLAGICLIAGGAKMTVVSGMVSCGRESINEFRRAGIVSLGSSGVRSLRGACFAELMWFKRLDLGGDGSAIGTWWKGDASLTGTKCNGDDGSLIGVLKGDGSCIGI